MKGFDYLNIKSAVKSRNSFDLSRTHLTTMDFGQIIPLMVEETIPGDQFEIDSNYFSRMAPMPVPTYGKFSFRTATIFVPYHQIAEDADAFIGGSRVWEGKTVRNRYITIGALHDFCKDSTIATTVPTTDPDSAADYMYINANGNKTRYKWNAKGKYWVKVLNALGYAMPEGVNEQSSSTWYTTIRTKKLSAYPLISFFKAYNDYMSQSQRFNTSTLSALLKDIKSGLANGLNFTVNGEITKAGLITLFSNLLLNYENDYFTSAWQNANYPISGMNSNEINAINVPKGRGEGINGDDNNTFLAGYDITTTSPASFTFTQRALDFLKSFDDWVRRNNYSGSRIVQRIYSRFGIKVDDYKSNYAHVLDTSIDPIQVGDITATAYTSDAALGEYAGKGIMSGSGKVSYKADDYGCLLVIGYFTVNPMMSFGFDKRVLRTEPLDYYNPEFDGLGADAISAGEVFENCVALDGVSADNTNMDQVYGYTERYNSYRFGRDVITGEFRDLHPSATMTAWHTGRDLTAIRLGSNLVAQNSSINTLPQYNSEYNRMFSVVNSSADHFYLTCQFSVKAKRPILNLSQSVRLGEGETTVPRNGNVIN